MPSTKTERLTKGELTRERLFDTALALFVSKGYHATTMREIAATAECSIGLTYRYFASKEDLVLALYRRLNDDAELHVQALPHTMLAARFDQLMRAKIAQVQPYRELFRSIIGAALSPENEIGVLGGNTADIRARAQKAFLQAVMGATDAPRNRQRDELATVLYAAHLGILLFWLYDRSPNQRATEELIGFARDMLKLGRSLMRLPPFAHALTRLTRAITPLFGAITAPPEPI
jgi:AcrR family transcriptional regulator